MKNINFALSWYTATICSLIFSLLLLVHLSFAHTVATSLKPPYQLYKSLPDGLADLTQQTVEIGKGDARALIIANFFKEHNAPLAVFADKFIEVADKYHLDYRLLPAISMQESNGGKKIPEGSYNPFGYGIYGSQILKFSSYDEAIEKVGQGLRNNYLNQGLRDPFQIMTKYTPPSLEKGGSWAIGVTAFMEQLR